jgi:hypothetical protein
LKILEDKQEDQDIKEKKLGQIGSEGTLWRSIERKGASEKTRGARKIQVLY